MSKNDDKLTVEASENPGADFIVALLDSQDANTKKLIQNVGKIIKAEFIEKYAERTGLPKKTASEAAAAFTDIIGEAIKSGDKVVFPGLFKAEARDIPEKTGRNPRTGEPITIPAKKVIKVKVTAKL